MAKTRGGHTVNTGRQLHRRREESATAPRTTRRLNRNLLKLAADLGASSKIMKRKGKSSSGTSFAYVSIPDSLPSNPNPHGTALTFRSPKFSNRFQKLMMNKNFVYGKFVDPALFRQIGVFDIFENIGLGEMLNPSQNAYPILIKQFFGNMTIKSDKIITFVQNRTLSIDTLLLGSVFKIPCSGVCPFTLKGPYEFDNFNVHEQLKIVTNSSVAEFVELPSVVETSPMNSVIHKIIRANLVPRTGGRSDMTFQDLIISALILSGTKFNFALFMIKHMESCLKNKTKCFPYGGFITKIFEHFNISFENEEVVQITEVIDEVILRNSMLKVNADGILSWDIEEPSQFRISSVLPSDNPTSSIPVPPSDNQLSALTHLVQIMDQKLDSVLSAVDSFTTILSSLSTRVATVTDKVDDLVARHNTLDDKLLDLDKKVDACMYMTDPDEPNDE